MHKHPELTERRIERFLKNELQPLLWARQVPMDALIWQRSDSDWPRPSDPVSPAVPAGPPSDAATYTGIVAGAAWGPIWSDAWFRLSGRIPEDWRGERIVARIDCGAEAAARSGARRALFGRAEAQRSRQRIQCRLLM